MTIFKAALCAAAFACAAPAGAAVVTYSGSADNRGFTQIALPKFISGTVVNSATYNISIFATGGFATTAITPVDITVTGSTNSMLFGSVGHSGSQTLTSPGEFTVFGNGVLNGTLNDGLDRFVGNGAYIDTFVSTFFVSGVNAITTGRGSTRVDYSIAFDITPAIPEPSTWALMLAGFGLVGYAMRRRRVAFA